ncbi:MAG: asparagine synthase (glutamine-hydrolyzing) [Bryobacteraceae bacterium]
MCGIAGFTHKNRKPEDGLIQRATQTLRHRGPDQQGVFESETISMGAVRLKIIDLAGGDQPIISDDGDVVIVFNGEIYNHVEVRHELERLGHSFRTRCDTEVVLEAFRQWDTACFSRLRGMFAAALWRRSDRRLVLARDRMGIKPLYLHQRGEDLYFGSELKAILEHSEVERRLDFNALCYYLSLNYVPTPWTLVKGITKLRPGHWLEWRDGVVRSEPYWQIDFQPLSEWKLPEAVEALDLHLRNSVREHLISDVPLGVWASGGLDSTTVLHYASLYTSKKIKTFSVSFKGQTFDESRYFRLVSKRYATEHHEFDLNTGHDLTDTITRMAYFSDEPSADAGALPVWYLSQMCRSQVTVALSGEGADEIFGGYNTYLADSYAYTLRATPEFPRRWALSLLEHLPVSDDKISFEYKVKRFLAGSLLPAADAHLFWNGACSRQQKEALLGRDDFLPPGTLFERLPKPANSAGHVNRFLWMDQLNYLPDDILYKCDRMSMAHSLEVRPPFLDHRIVEFAASLPEDLKVHGSQLKYVLKQLMSDKVPQAVVKRKKEGFDIPAHAWFRGPLLPLLKDTLTPSAIAASGVFQTAAVEQMIADHVERRQNLGYQLWGLLTLFLWMKEWNIQPPATN